MVCPKCGFEQPAGGAECVRCGVVFQKLRREEPPRQDAVAAWDALFPEAPASAPPPSTELPEIFDGRVVAPAIVDEPVLNGQLQRREIRIMVAGLVAAILFYWFPLTRFVLSALVTLFHEFSHAVAGWLLGHPSLPAFDFVYGGGFTHYGAFHPSIAVVLAAGLGFLGWHFRENKKSLILIGSVFLVWLFFVSAEWRREIAMAAAGHAGEFILAAIFFYQALAGVGLRSPEVERPLAAFAAFFVQIHSMLFAFRLTRDADFLAWYKEGKGGALMNDLEVVALDLHIYAKIPMTIEGVARLLILFSFVPIAVALVWYFQRARWHRLLHALRTVDRQETITVRR